jgi:hypothetical protein
MLNIYGFINDTGYGIHTRNFVTALAEFYNNCSLSPLGYGIQCSLLPHEVGAITSLMGRQEEMNFNDPCLVINTAGFLQYGAGSPRIGFPVFETTRFTNHALNQLKQMDYLFTPTQWSKEVLLNNEIECPIYIIHEGINSDIFHPSVSPQPFYKSSLFTFLSVGKYEVRKSQKEIIDAFCMEFGAGKEPVRLLLHCMTPFVPDWLNRVATQVRTYGFERIEPEITILPANAPDVVIFGKGDTRIVINQRHMLNADEMASLYKCGDVGLFVGKAEGWDLPLIECMAVGVPCIATGWTGHSEYVKKGDCYVIQEGESEIAYDGRFFKGNVGSWTKPSVEAIRTGMRKMYEDKGTREMIGQNGAKVASKYTWDEAGLTASDVLSEIIGE